MGTDVIFKLLKMWIGSSEEHFYKGELQKP